MSIATAAMVLAGCSEDNTASPADETRMTVITITASPEIENAPVSRTHYDETTGKIRWDADREEKIFVFESAASGLKEAESGAATLTGDQAQFTVAFATRGDSEYTYGAVYPSSNFVDGNSELVKIKAALPSQQTPTAESFDPAADLMMTMPVKQATQPSSLNFRFGRIAALAKMTITDLSLAADEKVKSVSFSAPNKVLAGRSYLDYTTGKLGQIGYYGASDKIELDLSAVNVAPASFPVWFTCLPCRIAEGETFTVTVTTDKFKTYTKTVTIPAGRDITFFAGDLAAFSVNMQGITGVESTSDARIATLTYEEVKGLGWTYNAAKEYTNAGGKWKICAYEQGYMQINGSSGYILLPNFSQPITMIEVVTNSTDKTLMLSKTNSSTVSSAIASQQGNKTTLFTLNTVGKDCTTGYLKSNGAIQIFSIKVYSGPAIVAADATAEAVGGSLTTSYTTSSFDAEDDTTVTAVDGTVVTSASADPTTKTVSFEVAPNLSGAEREGYITLNSANNGATTTFKVSQAKDIFTVTPEKVLLPGSTGGKIEVTLTSDFPVEAVASAPEKFSVSEPVDGVYTVEALADGTDTEAELGTITFTRTADNKQLVVTVAQAPQGSVGYMEYWKDDFSNVTGTATISSLKGSLEAFSGSYSSLTKVYAMTGAIKLGTASASGKITTPALIQIPENTTVDVKITFRAEGWNKKTATMTIKANNAGTVQNPTQTITSSSDMSGTNPKLSDNAATYTYIVTGATNQTTITLSSNLAVGIDDLLICTN